MSRWHRPPTGSRCRPRNSRPRAGPPRCAVPALALGDVPSAWGPRSVTGALTTSVVVPASSGSSRRDVAVGPGHLRVRRDLGVVADRGEAKAGGAEQLAPVRRRLRDEHLVEDGPEGCFVVLEVQERREALDQVRPADGLVEEVARGSCGAHDGDPPVGSREHAVDARDHGVAAATRSVLTPGPTADNGCTPRPAPRAVRRAARSPPICPRPVWLPRVERGQNAREQILP